MRICFKYTSFFLLLLMLCGLCTPIKAQSVEFGISRGINISTHTDKFEYLGEGQNVTLTPKLTTDIHLGLITRKNISSSLRLQFEPSISILGARYDEPISIQGEEFQTRSETQLKYLQLPLLFQFPIATSAKRFLGLPSPTTYHLTGGIFLNYLLDAQFEGTNKREGLGFSSESESFAEDVLLQYSRYDAGTILGAGLEYGSDVKIGFETRVQYIVLQAYQSDPRYKPKNFAVTFSLYLLL